MKKSVLIVPGILLALLFSGVTGPPLRGQSPTPPPLLIKPVVNREYLPAVLGMIEGARRSIDFIQLEFHYDPTVKKIQDALKAAAARGVAVRGILEDDISFNPKSNTFLNQFGIKSTLDTPKKATHNKLFIVDGEKVLIGSTNLSGNSIDNNNESNVYVEDARLGAFFTAYFENLLKDSFAEPELETLEIPGIRTVVNRQHFDALRGMLDGARKRVRVLMYGMKYYTGQYAADSRTNRLIDALIDAHKRSVDVKVILDRSNYNQTLNQINKATRTYLEAGGVEVREDPEAVTTHAKVVIADDRVMIGSANWGYLAMDIRNESSLIVSDPATVSFFEDYFMKIWGESAPVPPSPPNLTDD
ncbi:MAG: phospholipase D-like domain-containing protein [PVC group bacterium]